MPNLGEPPVLPYVRLPEPPVLPRPVLEVPRAVLPSYKPLVVPPSNLRPPPGVKGINSEESENKEQAKPQPKIPPIPKSSEIRYVDIPNTDITIPLPSNEILATAGTTAMVSVAATLTATSIFKRTVSLMKPVIKAAWTKITKKKGSSNSLSSSGPPDS
jgi:hypothetical protein